MSQVAEVIRGYRKFQGLTQQELAESIDVSPTAVSNWEQGIRLPEMRNVIMLIQHTKISADDILTAITYDYKRLKTVGK